MRKVNGTPTTAMRCKHAWIGKRMSCDRHGQGSKHIACGRAGASAAWVHRWSDVLVPGSPAIARCAYPARTPHPVPATTFLRPTCTWLIAASCPAAAAAAAMSGPQVAPAAHTAVAGSCRKLGWPVSGSCAATRHVCARLRMHARRNEAVATLGYPWRFVIAWCPCMRQGDSHGSYRTHVPMASMLVFSPVRSPAGVEVQCSTRPRTGKRHQQPRPQAVEGRGSSG